MGYTGLTAPRSSRKWNSMLKVHLICQPKDSTLWVQELSYQMQYIHWTNVWCMMLCPNSYKSKNKGSMTVPSHHHSQWASCRICVIYHCKISLCQVRYPSPWHFCQQITEVFHSIGSCYCRLVTTSWPEGKERSYHSHWVNKQLL